ncbi:MAG: sigma-54 dependent transcriptional regulator [Anaerolineales bacterium]|jgi:DNA-binding NtrC family response regulator|nr:sigma-54 dependent transcriptional regulator [Anaerolineales bacterium]
MTATILLVDDEETARTFVSEALRDAGYETAQAGDLAQAGRALDAGQADIVLLDVNLPDGSGLSLLDRIARENPSPPVIMITAYGEVEMAVEAMKKGAQDFLQKPLDFERLLQAVERAREVVGLRRELALLRQATHGEVEWVAGETPAMQRIVDEAKRAASASASVLITGETGTGKEILAQAIRNWGTRRDKPFVPINCAALPDTMIESELFGHEAGAFTGAQKRKPGLIEVADTGVLFLDEISSTKMDMQAKLLRVLDEQRFRRVGGVNEIAVDIQILAASNRDLPGMIRDHLFREDLYYRLKVVDLHLPPLRDRPGDIPALVGMFIRQFSQRTGQGITGITPRAIDALKAHRWPGNIRELRHTIERAVLFCDDEVIDLGHLPPEFQALAPAA